MKDGKGPPPPESKEIAAPDSRRAQLKGGTDAKVVIQVFSDFQCPFCKRVEPTIQAIEKEYGNKIKIVWRHMPLPFHKNAPHAAGSHSRSRSRRRVLPRSGPSTTSCSPPRAAPKPGTDRANLEKFAQEMPASTWQSSRPRSTTTSTRPRSKRDTEVGNDAGINGTPAFVINGYYISGAQPAVGVQEGDQQGLEGVRRLIRYGGGTQPASVIGGRHAPPPSCEVNSDEASPTRRRRAWGRRSGGFPGRRGARPDRGDGFF